MLGTFETRHGLNRGRMRGALLAAATSLLLLASPAASAVSGSWSYDDRSDSARKVINVRTTSLDTHQKRRYRVQVRGQEFVKNKTDLVRVYFDTRKHNAGPEYRVTWYLGRNPANPVGTTTLTRSDTWDDRGRSRACAGIRKHVIYRSDVITLSVPRRCLGRPSAVRWSGLTMKITRATQHQIFGYQDFFPAKFRFRDDWVA
jgi:hypothetical protein